MIKKGLFKRLENIRDMNLTQIQAIKDEGEQQVRERKSIGKSNTLKAIDDIRRKNHEADKILVDVRKVDTKLDTAENLFVQKLMELNTTLIFLCFD